MCRLVHDRDRQVLRSEPGHFADAIGWRHEWIADTQDGKGRDGGAQQALERREAGQLAEETQAVQWPELHVVGSATGNILVLSRKTSLASWPRARPMGWLCTPPAGETRTRLCTRSGAV